MDIITTNKERNIKYIARANQGKIIEHSDPKNEGGFQFLSFWQEYANNELMSGHVSVNVEWHQGSKMIQITQEAIRPNRERDVLYNNKMFHPYEYQQAKKNAIEYIKEAVVWIEKE